MGKPIELCFAFAGIRQGSPLPGERLAPPMATAKAGAGGAFYLLYKLASAQNQQSRILSLAARSARGLAEFTTSILICYNPQEMQLELFLKFVLNGFIQGSLYALLALGLSLLYGVLRFANLAHGEYALMGSFAFYTFYVLLGWPLLPSLAAGFGILFIVTLLIERLTFTPVRDAPPLIPLVISIALGIFLKNLLLLIFEPRSRLITANSSILQITDFISITSAQINIAVVAILLMIALTLFLKRTKLGKAIRAVADDREAAAILGIPIKRIVTITFLISAFLAGTAGILAAFDQNLHPNAGTAFTVKAFAAVILGGIGSIPGAVAGGYILGFAENILISIPFWGWYIPSNYKDALAYIILILVLYIRPNGIFGKSAEEIARK